MAGSHTGAVVVTTGVVVVTPGPKVVVGGVGLGAQGVPGTCHWPAESLQFSTWPLGVRQSLAWELSQVPGKREAG